jgi:hypothetical protein
MPGPAKSALDFGVKVFVFLLDLIENGIFGDVHINRKSGSAHK